MTLAFLTGFWVVVEAVTLLLLAELAKNELAAPWPREEKYRIWRAPFLLLKLLLFNKKWRSRHCFALHFDFLKNWSIFCNALFWQIFFRSVFRSWFFLLNSRVPVSQPVEQVSSRRGHGTEVASSHFLRNSHCQIFSHVYLNCSSFLSWISSMLRGRAEIANSWLLTVIKKRKKRRLNTKLILPFSQAKQ